MTSINVISGSPEYSSIDGILFNKDQTLLIKYPGGNTNSSYVIPAGVTSIGAKEFSEATFLTSISIPASVTSIDFRAFNGAKSLTSISVSNKNHEYSSIEGILFNKNQTELERYPEGNDNLTYMIPASVKSISSYAFCNIKSLTAVMFEKGSQLTSIGDYAFLGTTSLTSIKIPSSVESMGKNAFAFDKSLVIYAEARHESSGWDYDWNFNDYPVVWNVKEYGKYNGIHYARLNDDSITIISVDNTIENLVIPKAINNYEVKSIYDRAFYNNQKLKTVIFEEGSQLVSIGRVAFRCCTNLTSIIIPSTVINIDENAFYGCTSLTSIIIPNSMTIFDAIITLEDLYKNLYSTIFHYMMINAKMTINYNSVKVTAEVPNILLETSNMSFADIVNIISSSVSNSYSDAALNNSNPLNINVDHVSRALAEALISVNNKRLIRLIINSETSVTAQIENFKGSSFISIVANVSSISSQINKAICRRANSQVSCRARMLISDLIRNIANPMTPELIDCVGSIQSEMEKGIVLHNDSFTENIMQQDSVMIKSEIAKMQSRVEMTSDNEADVEKLLIRLLRFTETYKAEIESSMASLNSMIQESDISSKFTDDLRLEIYSAGESMGVRETFILNNESRLEALNYGEDYLKTRTVYQTFFDSELASAEPYLVNIEESFVDNCDALIETLNAEQTLKINANAFSTILNTNISIVNLEPLIGTIEHDALLFADITFDPSSWHNPVQINDVLEIYQVYEGEQEGMNLNLG